jgi:4-hydroxythreonine-4-phosphate dehydrogenase
MSEPGGEARKPRPRLAVTLGDARGIGPEVVAKALSSSALRDTADYVVVGPRGAWRQEAVPTEFLPVGEWRPALGAAAAGQLAGDAIRIATELALQRRVDGIVTAPLDKAAFQAGGWIFPGHTEMLKELCAADDVAMMMAAEQTRLGTGLRVVLATTHLPLRAVPAALSTPLLVQQALLTHAALRAQWQIADPRLVFCAINPHAGDGGLFGQEDSELIAPACEQLRSRGIIADGPVPADTVFVRALRGEWDAVIAPYHDVGMAAFKTAAFGHGVNVTLGLPFPRTSPDHGTALDIAGQDRADPSSMIEAIRLAARLASSFDTASQLI